MEDILKEQQIRITWHGSRTAGTATYPTDPIKDRGDEIWPEGKLQLTNAGKMEQYQLGIWLRQRYDKLLGDKYSSEKLYAMSTDSERTIMSAMSLMAGLFPPKGNQIWNQALMWQPIAISAYDSTAGGLLNTYSRINCPKYWTEFELMLKSNEYMELKVKHKELTEYIYKNTGFKIEDYRDLDYLYDYIESQTLVNVTIPEWAKKIYPEPWQSAAIYYFVLPTFTESLKRLFVGPMLKEIIDKFDDKILGKTNKVLSLYSGHDDNISNLLNVLRVFDWIIPPFSSALIFELRKDQENNYFVTLLYKNSTNDPHLLEILGCEPLCGLETFRTLISPYVPNNWTEECLIGLNSSKRLTGGIIIAPLLFLLSKYLS